MYMTHALATFRRTLPLQPCSLPFKPRAWVRQATLLTLQFILHNSKPRYPLCYVTAKRSKRASSLLFQGDAYAYVPQSKETESDRPCVVHW